MALLKHLMMYWLPALVWAGLIFWFSHQPTLPGPQDYWLNFAIKKPLHAVEFGILFWLIFRADVRSRKDVRRSIALAFWASVIYAALDELHQIFIPGREPTVRDFLFDSLGVFLAALVVSKKEKAPRV